MLGLDEFLKTLDPASILVGICFGTVLALACTAVGAYMSSPSKPKENKAVAVQDEPAKPLTVPVIDIGKLKSLAAKSVPAAGITVTVGESGRPASASVREETAPAPVEEVAPATGGAKPRGRHIVNPNLPSYRYQVAGCNDTYTSLKAVLAAHFPEAIKLQPPSHLFYDRLPQEVKSKILREKVN